MIISAILWSIVTVSAVLYSTSFIGPIYTDPDLVPYVNAFRGDCSIRLSPSECDKLEKGVVAYKIKRFAQPKDELDGSYPIGYCGPYLPIHPWALPRIITIHPDNWNRLGEMQRLSLVYHEMGHCVLGLDHIEDGGGGGETNLMHPVQQSELTIRLNWDSMVKGMFMQYKEKKHD